MEFEAHDVDLGKRVVFYVYDHGQISHTGDLEGDSAIIQMLGALIRQEKPEWRSSLKTFAPGIKFTGNQYSITLQPKVFILNYADKQGKWHQIVRDLAPEKFSEIKKLLAVHSEK